MAIGCVWLLEQPSSSLMGLTPRMLEVASLMKVFRCQTWMGPFGAPTAKASILFCNHQLVYKMHRKLNRKTFQGSSEGVVTAHEATGGITGGPNLRLTQVYPVGYAAALLESWASADLKELEQHNLPEDLEPQVTDLWLDAGMNEVAQYLGVPLDKLLV